MAYVISDKTRAMVDRLFTGEARERAIESLKVGKTVHCGPHKLKADKVETGKEKTPVRQAVQPETKTEDKDKDNKGKA